MTASALIANARMYCVAPGAAAAWRSLFEWLAETTSIRLDVIDHAFPAPLAALWSRTDLGAAFMCGWPFARRLAPVRLVAAPIPKEERADGRPLYWTDLVVNAQAGFESLESTFGHRLVYTETGSHSGYNAVRRLMLERAEWRTGPPLYAQVVGPVVTPRRAAEAVISGSADLAPLDSYAHSLLRLHDCELARQLRVVARTEPTTIPALVAHETLSDAIVDRLREGLLSAGSDPQVRALLEKLDLAGFAAVTRDDYQATLLWSSEAEEAGFDLIKSRTDERHRHSAL